MSDQACRGCGRRPLETKRCNPCDGRGWIPQTQGKCICCYGAGKVCIHCKTGNF